MSRSQPPVSRTNGVRNLAALRPRRSESATRACATALALPPAAACHPGHTLRPLAPAACVPAAPPLRRSARAARHCPPLVGGQLPAGRPVTPAAQIRLTAGSRCASPQRRGAGGAPGAGHLKDFVALADSRQSFARSSVAVAIVASLVLCAFRPCVRE